MIEADRYRGLGAVEIARLVADREVGAEEVVRAALARLDEVEPTLRAFREVWPEPALAAAREIDRRVATGERPPLAGVPIGVKAWEARDDRQPRRLREAGCVPIGATAVPGPGTAWRTWGWTDRGPTTNPWRSDRTPGGSSAGSAAAVAAGVVPLATGIDGAGSIRVPAAWCGVLGLKVTGGVPAGRDRSGLAAPGPLCRSPADAARYLGALLGHRPAPTGHRPGPVGVPPGPDSQPGGPADLSADRGAGGAVRAAWSADLGFAEVRPAQRDLARAAARRLVGAGAVVELPVPVTLRDPAAAWLAVRAGDPDAARVVRAENDARLRALFTAVDVLLTPTTPGPPHPHTGPGPTINTSLTWAFNLSGHPAVTLPAGLGPDGCPAGLQVVARPGAESLLLRVARSLLPGPLPVPGPPGQAPSGADGL